MNRELHAGNGGFGEVNAFACGILCGAVLGAAVALLYAPKSGAETRRQMSSSAQRFKRRAAAAYEDASHAVGDVMAKSRRAIEVGREAFNDARTADTHAPLAGVPRA